MQEIRKALDDLESRFREQAGRNVNTICQAVICEKCGGLGQIITVDDEGRTYAAECDCEKVKRARRLLEKSGLVRAVEAMTFGAYRAQEAWQRSALHTAQAWTGEVTNGKAPWLFFGGQPGSGKTHLCTAACGELLRAGIAVHYMLWTETSRQLKACINDGEAFDRLMRPLKDVPVLYIDDLFKARRGDQRSVQEAVTSADVRVAFEIINARTLTNRPTIISTEWMLDELIDADEATFSRVNLMSEGYQVQIGRGKGRNWRMKGASA